MILIKKKNKLADQQIRQSILKNQGIKATRNDYFLSKTLMKINQ